MNSQIMETTEQYVLHTYNRFPISIERGEGVRVKDADGKEYLDFMSGIGVYALGYHYPGYDEALIAQIGKVIHTSNLYYSEPLMDASKRLIKATGLSKVFFTNSGAEAIEGAIKSARKYARTCGRDAYEIIAFKDSFHGRTVGALSVTGNAHYQEPFEPLMGGVRFAEFNSIESVKACLTDKTCAIIIEPVQGEGGVIPADPDFMREIRQIADAHDLVLILDEIQCGMGRTGTMWAYEQYGIRPDILTCAKALGCGVPVGAFVLSEKLAGASLVPGDHGTTYGGNPLVTAAAAKVLEIFENDGIPDKAAKRGQYLASRLESLASSHGSVIDTRGMGLMRGLVLDPSVKAGDIASAALKEGLLIITAGGNVLRFLPPLIITEEEIDEAAAILDRLL